MGSASVPQAGYVGDSVDTAAWEVLWARAWGKPLDSSTTAPTVEMEMREDMVLRCEWR